MAPSSPTAREPEVTERALAEVREDKQREAGDGFDGTWVAHPDLVPVAGEIFDAVLGERPNQKERCAGGVARPPQTCSTSHRRRADHRGRRARQRAASALQYLDSWLRGNGAAAINNLMEDAATAEISRSQLWQWRTHGHAWTTAARDGRALRGVRDEELAGWVGRSGPSLGDAAGLLDGLALSDDFADFLTLPAYARLG